jgi:hypothetical protein
MPFAIDEPLSIDREEHQACAWNPSAVFAVRNNKSRSLGPGSLVYKASGVRVSTPLRSPYLNPWSTSMFSLIY